MAGQIAHQEGSNPRGDNLDRLVGALLLAPPPRRRVAVRGPGADTDRVDAPGPALLPLATVTLEVNKLALLGLFRSPPAAGVLHWRGSASLRARAEVTVRQDQGARAGRVTLTFVTHEGKTCRQTLETEETLSYGAGLRPWFLCPGDNTRPCGRRVMKLYLPRAGTRFACRSCHALTYTRASRAPRPQGPMLTLSGFTATDTWAASGSAPATPANR